MLVYRACNEIEASYQEIGKPRVAPPDHLLSEKWEREKDRCAEVCPGRDLAVTFFSEVWRRNQNKAQENVGFFWGHTLLLEIPDDSEEFRVNGLAGMEYRPDPKLAIVRGIAGPEWPLPDWVPQPQDEKDWNPKSTNWRDPHIWLWVPRGIDPMSLWWYPLQPAQRENMEIYKRQKNWEMRFGPFQQLVNRAYYS